MPSSGAVGGGQQVSAPAAVTDSGGGKRLVVGGGGTGGGPNNDRQTKWRVGYDKPQQPSEKRNNTRTTQYIRVTICDPILKSLTYNEELKKYIRKISALN